MGNAEKCLVPLLVLHIFFLPEVECAADGRIARNLHQRENEEMEITRANVDNLQRLVRRAASNTTFVFTADVQLPSMIRVNTSNLTFRGEGDLRPNITCAEGEEGFVINATDAVFENLVIRNCQKTAVWISSDVKTCGTFDTQCKPSELQSLGVTVQRVDFIGNNGTLTATPAGALFGGEKTRLRIQSCSFEGNEGSSGSAITFGGDMLIVRDSLFLENAADRTGGAISAIHPQNTKKRNARNVDISIDIRNCTFIRNRVRRGAADHTGLTSARGLILENNPYLEFPQPSPSGGALLISNFKEALVHNCNFTQNSAATAGGAIYLSDNRDIEITGCEFSANSIPVIQERAVERNLMLGGAVFAAFSDKDTQLQIAECSFTENSAEHGGGLHVVSPLTNVLTISNCTFNSNQARQAGGAVAFRNIQAPIFDFTRFINNSADVGGAILLTNGAGLDMVQGADVTRANVFENNAAFDGGAIFGLGSGPTKLFSTCFRRNHAHRFGGAVCYVDSKAGGSLVVQEACMYDNSAEIGGAIYLENAPDVKVQARSDERHPVTGETLIFNNEFINNFARAGGAIRYRASNLVGNNFQIAKALFKGNRLVSNVSDVIGSASRSFAARGNVLQLLTERVWGSEDGLLDPRGARPCHPGGGGAMCLILSGASTLGPVSVQISESNFTENSALVGGGLLITTEEGYDWRVSCQSNEENRTLSTLETDRCRSVQLRALQFAQNKANASGGAIFASNLAHVHYSSVVDLVEAAAESSARTLDMLKDADIFMSNEVGDGGYGPNIAGTAVRLNISRPDVAGRKGLIAGRHPSGLGAPLRRIDVQLLDGLDQVVTGGIVDSVFRVQADARTPVNHTPVTSGEAATDPKNGVAVFDALTLSAIPATYVLEFSVVRNAVKRARGNVIIRECVLGERYNAGGLACEPCASETFTIYSNVSTCAPCPDNARCAGNASLVPASGYWHSTPLSVIMHECFRADACTYENRTDDLEKARAVQLPAFLRRLRNGTSNFTNEQYPQCATGYEGHLCGSCSDGYGRLDDFSCVKCNSRTAAGMFLLLVGMWQLVFLGITLRSAVVSIRDMRMMVTLRQSQRPQNSATDPQGGAHAARTLESRDRLISVCEMDEDWGPSQVDDGLVVRTDDENDVVPVNALVNCVAGASTANPSPNQQDQLSGKRVIVTQHLSETLKILINFLQITSVAASVNSNWGSSIKNFLIGMNSVAGSSSSMSFSPMACVADPNSDMKAIHVSILRVLFPVALTAVAMSVFVPLRLRSRHHSSQDGSTTPGSQTAQGNQTTQDSQTFKSLFIVCLLVAGFFAYQSLAQEFMGTVSCTKLDGNHMGEAREYDDESNNIYSTFSIAGSRYWTHDTNIECFTGNHAFLVGFLGVPGMLLFVVGVPVYLLVYLFYQNRNDRLEEPEVLNTYGFVYQNYKKEFVYWESCILLRKALISAILVFGYPLGANLQGVLALGVLTFGIAIHWAAIPYEYDALNVLEGASLMVSFLTFFAGAVFNDENTSDEVKDLLSVLLFITNVSMVVIFLVMICLYADQFITAKLLFYGVSNDDIPRNPIYRFDLFLCVLYSRGGTHVVRLYQRCRRVFCPSADRGYPGTVQLAVVRETQTGEI